VPHEGPSTRSAACPGFLDHPKHCRYEKDYMRMEEANEKLRKDANTSKRTFEISMYRNGSSVNAGLDVSSVRHSCRCSGNGRVDFNNRSEGAKHAPIVNQLGAKI